MSSPLSPRDLVITHGTAAFAPFAEHAAATAAAGCRGVSIWIREYKAAIDAGAKPAELGRLLDDQGVGCNDVDAHVVWAGAGNEDASPLRGLPLELCVESGQVLGARFANLVITGDEGYEFARGADAFAAAAATTLAAGLIPTQEFVPQPVSPVDDIAKAWAIVEASGIGEAGLMLDTWHFTRGPSTLEMLSEVPLDRVLGLQINDVGSEAWDDPMRETMHARLLPGQGSAPLVPILQALDAGHAPAACTIEIFSDAHSALDAREAVRRAVAATESVLTRAGSR